jgi:membrane protease YdiL (CAAX protease family)
MVGMVLLISGKSGREAARKALRLPESRGVLLALLLPVVIGLGCASLQYGIDRADWAAHNFGKTSPPQFYSYLDAGSAWDPWLLFLVFGAFAEEIVFRGILLGRLMREFGSRRGIFFTGMTWAAIHFRADSYFRLSVPEVLYHLAWRILFCLALNYVFCRMTLRWKSVIPAAVTHTISNMIALSGINNEFPWGAEFTIVLWVVVALALFHYWPLSDEEAAVVGPTSPESVAVV